MELEKNLAVRQPQAKYQKGSHVKIRDLFYQRHIGPDSKDIALMLKALGAGDMESLIAKAAPSSILAKTSLDLPDCISESAFLKRAKQVAEKNQIFKSYIGQGYYDCHTPTVILRNILENPAWYTAYTPYQAEISQGRMEALLNFQTMVMDLTGMEMANASLLDEATAAAEAMTMAFNLQKKSTCQKIFVSENMFPQTIEVLQTRAEPLGIELIVGDPRQFDFAEPVFAVMLQYPDSKGCIADYRPLAQKAKDNGAFTLVAADILALCLLTPPGEWGADVVFGSTQRFGVPMGYGGPHAAYIATKDEYKRMLPGRIIGVSKDSYGKPALRLALQTREQHIRREKATSNICTAQVLLAVMASMYAVYHGPAGLRSIANQVHTLTNLLARGLLKLGFELNSQSYFDCLFVKIGEKEKTEIINLSKKHKLNLGIWASGLSINLDETTTLDDVETLLCVFGQRSNLDFDVNVLHSSTSIPSEFVRKSQFLTHPIFNTYHSETEMLRYIRRLESKDLTLANSMIPLGSCTMKLNATSEMIPVTWPEFGKIHPFAPIEQAAGYLEMIQQLQKWLVAITGFAGVSLQPNAGSQGEYAGLLVIRKYHQEHRQTHRNICLIPSSAHGTNPASAVMAGMQVVVVNCDDHGNIDLADLKQKAKAHKDNLAALMVTYPSTHGVFEETIVEICNVVHECGGLVYMDGANMNALVGIARPGDFGPDVCHLNLHKTFCIPHGGGGPGIGPIGVAKHLIDYLPTHSLLPECGPKNGISAVSAAPFGSASILPISWGYIAMMGRFGVKKATEVAILNANYIAKKLENHFPVLYKGKHGLVAHECIIDVRQFKTSAGITVDDIAKRLIDYGFHAPTMSWPVAGTLMIEPTESESLEEIDRFCDAMISIREEIAEIENSKADKENNVLKNAPHSVTHLMTDSWDHPYSREKAAFPLGWVREHKFWTPVGRVDNAYGDRNLVCSCPSIESYS